MLISSKCILNMPDVKEMLTIFFIKLIQSTVSYTNEALKDAFSS